MRDGPSRWPRAYAQLWVRGAWSLPPVCAVTYMTHQARVGTRVRRNRIEASGRQGAGEFGSAKADPGHGDGTQIELHQDVEHAFVTARSSTAAVASR